MTHIAGLAALIAVAMAVLAAVAGALPGADAPRSQRVRMEPGHGAGFFMPDAGDALSLLRLEKVFPKIAQPPSMFARKRLPDEFPPFIANDRLPALLHPLM